VGGIGYQTPVLNAMSLYKISYQGSQSFLYDFYFIKIIRIGFFNIPFNDFETIFQKPQIIEQRTANRCWSDSMVSFINFSKIYQT
jgi:hypothetical protein